MTTPRPDVARARQRRAVLKSARPVGAPRTANQRRRIRAMVAAVDDLATSLGIRPRPTGPDDVYARGVRDGVLLALTVATSHDELEAALGALLHSYARWEAAADRLTDREEDDRG